MFFSCQYRQFPKAQKFLFKSPETGGEGQEIQKEGPPNLEKVTKDFEKTLYHALTSIKELKDSKDPFEQKIGQALEEGIYKVVHEGNALFLPKEDLLKVTRQIEKVVADAQDQEVYSEDNSEKNELQKELEAYRMSRNGNLAFIQNYINMFGPELFPDLQKQLMDLHTQLADSFPELQPDEIDDPKRVSEINRNLLSLMDKNNAVMQEAGDMKAFLDRVRYAAGRVAERDGTTMANFDVRLQTELKNLHIDMNKLPDGSRLTIDTPKFSAVTLNKQQGQLQIALG